MSRLTNKQVLARVTGACTAIFAGWTWMGWQLHTRAVDTANAIERRIAQDVGWIEEKDGKLICLSGNATANASVTAPVTSESSN